MRCKIVLAYLPRATLPSEKHLQVLDISCSCRRAARCDTTLLFASKVLLVCHSYLPLFLCIYNGLRLIWPSHMFPWVSLTLSPGINYLGVIFIPGTVLVQINSTWDKINSTCSECTPRRPSIRLHSACEFQDKINSHSFNAKLILLCVSFILTRSHWFSLTMSSI
jgi:hypothetical protein